MFNNYTVKTDKNSTQNINIVEKRAPTDDSIKLLHEMEEKAFNSVIKQVDVDNNILKGKVVYYGNDYPIQELVCVYSFILSGNRYDVKNSLSFNAMKIKTNKDIVFDFYEAISKEITKQLLLTSKNNENLSKEINKWNK